MSSWNVIISGLILAAPAWMIFKRAGLQPAFGLLVFIPAIGPLFALLLLAFMDWPATAGGGRHGS